MGFFSLIFLLIAVKLSFAAESSEDRVVQIDQGLVRGFKSEEGNYFEFYNIFFAGPPTGKYRFKAPRPPPTWDGILNATDRKIWCVQRNSYGHDVKPDPNIHTFGTKLLYGQEDCLVVNVFVPYNVSYPQKTPVIFFIHGGAFESGCGAMYVPKHLLDRGVVVVNFNYRLSVMGFLCLRTEEVPGNAGMKDMVAALRWVKRNIAAFGGDPDQITLFGESSGGVAVHLMTLTPSTRGLFKGVISSSASALVPWAINTQPLYNAEIIANFLGEPFNDYGKIIDLFQTTDPFEILKGQLTFQMNDTTIYNMVCIELPLKSEESFLVEHPFNMLTSAAYDPIPLVIGYNSNEGVYQTSYFKKSDNILDMMYNNFSNFLPEDLHFENNTERDCIANIIRQFYFGHDKITSVNTESFIDYYTDILFFIPIMRAIDVIINTTKMPVYLYEFGYEGDCGVGKLIFNYTAKGVPHVDDVGYLFEIFPGPFRLTPFDRSPNDRLMINQIATLWANFAKFRKPLPQETYELPVPFEEVNKTILNYFFLDLPPQAKREPYKERVAFWKLIYDKYYSPPTIFEDLHSYISRRK